MRLDGSAWQEFFDSFELSAFRLETLSVYNMPEEDEEFRVFRETGKLEVPDDDWWFLKLRHYRDTGRWIGRVHVLRRPLTEYLRFQIAFYAQSVRHGEDIRILDVTDDPEVELPDHDFWFFDDKLVVEMRYAPDGTQLGRELLESPDLTRYQAWKERALARSEPLMDFMNKIES